MIVVISCAGRKKPEAGYFRRKDGQRVKFVGNPELAPEKTGFVCARPDDPSDTGASWRERLVGYNADHSDDNPFGLLPAGRLYADRTYSCLVDRYGIDGFYILSAGWGLIRADFLTPKYDITFSPQAKEYQRRRPGERWCDLNHLPDETTEPVVFFGGKGYVPLFCRLTERVQAERTVWTASARHPKAPGCVVEPYRTTTRTNWHYECVHEFLDGKLDGLDASRSKASP